MHRELVSRQMTHRLAMQRSVSIGIVFYSNMPSRLHMSMHCDLFRLSSPKKIRRILCALARRRTSEVCDPSRGGDSGTSSPLLWLRSFDARRMAVSLGAHFQRYYCCRPTAEPQLKEPLVADGLMLADPDLPSVVLNGASAAGIKLSFVTCALVAAAMAPKRSLRTAISKTCRSRLCGGATGLRRHPVYHLQTAGAAGRSAPRAAG